MHHFTYGYQSGFMVHPGFLVLIILLVLWTIVWKGLALWKAGRRGELAWFIVLLVVNTLGILEILYLYVFSNEKIDRSSVEGQHHK